MLKLRLCDYGSVPSGYGYIVIQDISLFSSSCCFCEGATHPHCVRKDSNKKVATNGQSSPK